MQRIQTLCDICFVNGSPDTEAAYLELNVSNGVQVTVVDVCDVHKRDLDERLNLYMEAGRRPDRVPMPVTRSERERERKRKYKYISRIDPATGFVPPGDYHCTEPDCERSFETQQGVRMHLSRAHGIIGQTSKIRRAGPTAVAQASEAIVAKRASAAERKKERDRSRSKQMYVDRRIAREALKADAMERRELPSNGRVTEDAPTPTSSITGWPPFNPATQN